MNIILYLIIFVMGTFFGSFYTLAVYRIPKKIDIVKTHSFCPNCNHKLGFWELIPVWSYIFLGGKCKECKQKIRPRYFILEVLSGLTYVLIAIALKLDFLTLNVNELINLAFLALYLVALFIISGIDKERRVIQKSVLYYVLVIFVMYIIYLYIIDNTSIYRYMMYLTAAIILLIVDAINLTRTAKDSYVISMLMFILAMFVFTGEIVAIISIILALFIILATFGINKLKEFTQKIKNENANKNLPIGFYLGISNVISLIVYLFINNWCM